MNTNAWQVVRDFEKAMCEYTGSPHAVAADTGTAAIHLSLEWEARRMAKCRGVPYTRDHGALVILPRRTYVSVPCVAIHAGYRVAFKEIDNNWQERGWYELRNTGVVDSACLLTRGMHSSLFEKEHRLVCLSFQYRKHLKIGRGGMILTDDEEAAKWLKLARYSGRHEVPLMQESGLAMVGWHYFMEPERAARGLQLLQDLPEHNDPLKFDYPDLSKMEVF